MWVLVQFIYYYSVKLWELQCLCEHWVLTYSIIYIVAAFSSLRSVIVVELMGLDKLTTCYSQLVIFHGMAVILGAPLLGNYSILLFIAQ